MTTPDSPDSPEVTVQEDPGRHRFEVLSGEALAGFSQYLEHEEDGTRQRIFFHTEIDDAYEGQGLASQLTRTALTDSVAAGFRIVPVCPYVKRWLGSHDDVEGHVDRVRPEHLEALRR